MKLSITTAPNQTNISAVSRCGEPFSLRQVLFLAITLLTICGSAFLLITPVSLSATDYARISGAIRQWDFTHLPQSQAKQFWGLPYLSALLASLFRVSDAVVLEIIAFCAYVIATVFCYRLWGGAVAAWFTVLNWTWLRETVGGGVEPLFLALVFGAFLAAREKRWILAAALATGATLTRPVGIFALVGIGVVLLARRDLRKAAVATLIGIVAGIAYIVPMILIFGDPLANVHGYAAQDWTNSLPITVPFLPLIRGAFIRSDLRLPLQILIAFSAVLTIAGVARMIASRHFRSYAKEHPVEAVFCGTYALFLFSYNANYWDWLEFPRFALPLLPFVLLAFSDRLPKDRRLLWFAGLAAMVSVLAPVRGVDHVYHVIRNILMFHS